MNPSTKEALDQLIERYDKATHDYFHELHNLFNLVAEYDSMLVSYYSKKKPATQQIMKNQYKLIKTKTALIKKLQEGLDWYYQISYNEKKYTNTVLALKSMNGDNIDYLKSLFELS